MVLFIGLTLALASSEMRRHLLISVLFVSFSLSTWLDFYTVIILFHSPTYLRPNQLSQNEEELRFRYLTPSLTLRMKETLHQALAHRAATQPSSPVENIYNSRQLHSSVKLPLIFVSSRGPGKMRLPLF